MSTENYINNVKAKTTVILLLKHNSTIIVSVVVKLINHSPNSKQKELILLYMVGLGILLLVVVVVVFGYILHSKFSKILIPTRKKIQKTPKAYRAPGEMSEVHDVILTGGNLAVVATIKNRSTHHIIISTRS